MQGLQVMTLLKGNTSTDVLTE